jgi:hypothetical protein
MKRRTGHTVSLAILLGGITGSELVVTLDDAGSQNTEGGILA